MKPSKNKVRKVQKVPEVKKVKKVPKDLKVLEDPKEKKEKKEKKVLEVKKVTALLIVHSLMNKEDLTTVKKVIFIMNLLMTLKSMNTHQAPT
jgi:hypothetical protein